MQASNANLPIVTKASEAIASILKDPDIRKQWEALGAVPLYSPPKAFDEAIRSDAERYAKLVNSAGEHFPETGSPVYPDEHRSGVGNQASYDPALD